jgi:predicted nucleotide-binding protein (sugar kinase/HSP70/actin superfamily)
MSKKVGIPRGLFYYQYFPLWKIFLEELGAEIVISDYSNKRILDNGVKNCVDEACLPVKLFHGHVLDIKDRVDYLFIPRFTSVSKGEYICPKFGGLPDMVRNTLKNLPPIIDTEVDLRKSKSNSFKAAMEVGLNITRSKTRIKKAYKKALTEYRKYKEEVSSGVLPGDILRGKNVTYAKREDNRGTEATIPAGSMLNIALIGHAYNVYDSFINMELIEKLRNNRVNIITVDTMGKNLINKKSRLLNKKMFWNFGRKALGCAFHILDRDDIDGVIYLMSFGCGIDSFVCDLAERKIRRNSNIPFIILTIDEHSGEAGMNTRIEAFIDMIRWRKKDEVDVSAFR